MQQQELAQMRQRDANLTALAAIGPRKKRKVDSPGSGSGTEVQYNNSCMQRSYSFATQASAAVFLVSVLKVCVNLCLCSMRPIVFTAFCHRSDSLVGDLMRGIFKQQ